ncbi:uncharacterized protein LOC132170680 isoform X1 [Corylus avellana]|uniref:uncharacterized protein LOC132170680 isoform X1 n=1 Tax=Corylus avellana TaxID=13451 RepID=UPI00286CC70D|nr:uncharacterized protein LOC132170680 isoform X1 [Corylus avellana]
MDGSEKEGGDEPQRQNEVKGSNPKGKSCKGYLYFNSALKSKARNPRCIGIPRTLQQVPDNIVSQMEIEASKEGRSLADFNYACVGYSVFLDRGGNDPGIDKQAEKAELPVCVGLEILVDRRVSADGPASTPAHIHNREEEVRELPQPRRRYPAHSVADDFLSRFTRNANLISSGVARNMRRVGNSIKETLDDILYPYRKRPK